jgi:hypothetical protein
MPAFLPQLRKVAADVESDQGRRPLDIECAVGEHPLANAFSKRRGRSFGFGGGQRQRLGRRRPVGGDDPMVGTGNTVINGRRRSFLPFFGLLDLLECQP